MRYKIWGNGSGGPAIRGANREVDLESVVISGGAWAGRYWWSVGRYIETTDDAYVGANVTALAPHVHGFVAQVLVADNERVHAGQLLVKLDPRDFQAALDHATAVLAGRTTDRGAGTRHRLNLPELSPTRTCLVQRSDDNG